MGQGGCGSTRSGRRAVGIAWGDGEQAVKVTCVGSFSGHPDGGTKDRQLSQKLAHGHQLKKTHRLLVF